MSAAGLAPTWASRPCSSAGALFPWDGWRSCSGRAVLRSANAAHMSRQYVCVPDLLGHSMSVPRNDLSPLSVSARASRYAEMASCVILSSHKAQQLFSWSSRRTLPSLEVLVYKRGLYADRTNPLLSRLEPILSLRLGPRRSRPYRQCLSLSTRGGPCESLDGAPGPSLVPLEFGAGIGRAGAERIALIRRKWFTHGMPTLCR